MVLNGGYASVDEADDKAYDHEWDVARGVDKLPKKGLLASLRERLARNEPLIYTESQIAHQAALDQRAKDSWERIFTPEVFDSNWVGSDGYNQANFEILRLENVKKVTEFHATWDKQTRKLMEKHKEIE